QTPEHWRRPRDPMATPHSLTFGALLRRYRRAAGLTQAQLAERATNMPIRTISDLERGVNRTPHQETLDLLVEALALSPEERTLFEALARRRGTRTTARFPRRATTLLTHPLTPLSGRERELTQLARYLAGEGPPVLLLAGEPGIGKTRLLAEAGQLALQSH